MGYSPWGRKESDTTEPLHFTSLHFKDWIVKNETEVTGKKLWKNCFKNPGKDFLSLMEL